MTHLSSIQVTIYLLHALIVSKEHQVELGRLGLINTNDSGIIETTSVRADQQQNQLPLFTKYAKLPFDKMHTKGSLAVNMSLSPSVECCN